VTDGAYRRLALNQNKEVHPISSSTSAGSGFRPEKKVYSMEFEDELLPRLRDILANRDLGNGTPLADAAADAIAADARSAGVAMPDVQALTDERLRAAADEIHRHVNNSAPGSDVLPFGTLLPGITTLCIGNQALLQDAGRAGLHDFETLREDAHGPNLDRLLATIEQMTGGKPYRVIGLPTPTSVGDIGVRHNLDFPPFAGAGGVVMRQCISKSNDDIFCSLMPSGIEELAGNITRAMAYLWTMRESIGNRVNAVRHRVETLLISQHGASGPVALCSIAYDWGDDGGENSENPYLQIQYDALDTALRPGVVTQPVHGDMDLNGPNFYVDDRWAHRSCRKAELLAQGAIGEIDEVAAAIVRAVPAGERAVLQRLSKNLSIRVALPSGRSTMYATLEWNDGRVQAHFREFSIRTCLGGLELRAVLPETIIAAAVGLRMSTIAELPFAFDGVIKALEHIGEGWLRFTFAPRSLLIDADTGGMRAD
jgi:hypothetical protein